MPRSRCRRSSRASICAWTVTSSAVVGSSAISRRGLQAIAIAIITRWPCRPRAGAERRRGGAPASGISTSLQQLQRARRAAPAREPPSCRRSVSIELEGDGEAGFEARQRVLEDHRDVAAEQRAALARAHRLQVAAVEGEALGADAAGKVDQAEHGERGDALARARFADDADDLAGSIEKLDVVDRLTARAPRRAERRRARRSMSSSAVMASRSRLQLRVERIAQAVAHQVEREHRDQDREAGQA